LGELRDLVNNFIESRMPDEYRRMQTYDALLIERNVDEYYSIKFPGAYTAVNDFIKNNINFKIMKNKTYKWEFNRYYLTRV
jgi:hypothetical protein